MPDNRPPFRADAVGSLLRSGPLKEARAKRALGQLSADQLVAIEDEEIKKIIQKQQEVGLQLATDGEFRRSWWHFDFLWKLQGCERVVLDHGIQFHGMQTKPESIRVTGRIDFPADHPMLEHFRFLQANCEVMPKMTIPSPAVLHFRGGRDAISKQVYPDLDAYFDDLGRTWGKAVKAFYDAGCRYLQFDDTVWAYLCSKEQMDMVRARGEDPDQLPAIYARTINRALQEKPADMTITTHICRGNFRSTWISEGGYEPIAERLLGDVAYDGYFLEYDSDRAGGLEPLRFLPKGKKRVVVGLVTSKSGRLEDVDDIKRRLEEAAEFAPIEQLCLSPQCGFASTEEGNILSEAEQWAKLGMIVAIAREVWQ
jgi:5-methyltetrahydropteroyltriglutamate--homocysteine methyltransferase